MKAASFVLDTSITMSWCFEDEATPFTDSLLDRLEKETAKVPSLWTLEVMNVLLIAQRKKRLSHLAATQFKNALNALPIVIDEFTTHHVTGVTYELAKETSLTIYDATYLELAKREKLPLATLDRALAKAAKAHKISVLPL